MAIGTAFTLFFVPSIYLLIAKDHGARRRVAAEPGNGSNDLAPYAAAGEGGA
jgi:hypothetical protein